MLIVNKAKAAWSAQRSCWRIDIQYQLNGESKRTFVNVPDCEPDKGRGASKAESAAREFRKGLGGLYTAFAGKLGNTTPAPAPKPVRSPMKIMRRPSPTIGWLLDQCLTHPEVWGEVKHSRNYVSGAKKLSSIIGDRMVTEFEPPHGRKLVIELVETLKGDGFSKGYVRKVAYQLRQALRACIGDGVTRMITHPDTGEQLLTDVPTFPPLPKSPGRTAVLERDHDQIVFAIIRARIAKALEEERAHDEQRDQRHLLGVGAKGSVIIAGETVWLNPRRFSSRHWMTFEAYVRFLIETGCRRSEALSVGNHSIRDREVVGEAGEVIDHYQVLHLPGEVTKNGEERFINLTPSLVEAKKLWEAWAEPHSFKIGDRTVKRDRAWFALHPNQVTNMWNHVRADAKTVHAVDLSAVSPHNLRHTHATRMSARGLSGKGLSDSLGHSDVRTTRIYDHAQSVDQSRRYFARNVSG